MGEKTSPERSSDEKVQEEPQTKAGKPKKHDANLGMALHNVFWVEWWTAGIFKLISGMRPEILGAFD